MHTLSLNDALPIFSRACKIGSGKLRSLNVMSTVVVIKDPGALSKEGAAYD